MVILKRILNERKAVPCTSWSILGDPGADSWGWGGGSVNGRKKMAQRKIKNVYTSPSPPLSAPGSPRPPRSHSRNTAGSEQLGAKPVYEPTETEVTIQAPVVQKVDSGIHWINLYPLGNANGFLNTFPWIATYPVGSAIQRLNNWGQEWELGICVLLKPSQP